MPLDLLLFDLLTFYLMAFYLMGFYLFTFDHIGGALSKFRITAQAAYALACLSGCDRTAGFPFKSVHVLQLPIIISSQI